MKIKELELLTYDVESAKIFYHELMGFEIVHQSTEAISFKAGASTLTFKHLDLYPKPTYHFAFNIPKNQMEAAQNWLKARVTLQKDEKGNTIVDFKNWNAQAVYFYDSLGNIVELIARHGLENASNVPFSAQSMLSVSEIGVPSDDVNTVAATIQKHFKIPTYKSGSDKFHPLGDEEGLLINVPTGRVWYMTEDLVSAKFPIKVTVETDKKETILFDEGLVAPLDRLAKLSLLRC